MLKGILGEGRGGTEKEGEEGSREEQEEEGKGGRSGGGGELHLNQSLF